MKLKTYLEKYDIKPIEFAVECGISIAAVYFYMNGKKRPHQKTAERIEYVTRGQVTVKDLRGKDDRNK